MGLQQLLALLAFLFMTVVIILGILGQRGRSIDPRYRLGMVVYGVTGIVGVMGLIVDNSGVSLLATLGGLVAILETLRYSPHRR